MRIHAPTIEILGSFNP